MADEKGSPERRVALLETCFEVFCKNGLENTGLKMLAEACGVTNGALLYYFETKDNIVIESTAHCMAKVEDDFMARAPRSFADIERFLREMPYITAKLHGEKYRFMYQVYASPTLPGTRQSVLPGRECPLPPVRRAALRQAGDAGGLHPGHDLCLCPGLRPLCAV